MKNIVELEKEVVKKQGRPSVEVPKKVVSMRVNQSDWDYFSDIAKANSRQPTELLRTVWLEAIYPKRAKGKMTILGNSTDLFSKSV